MLNFIIEYEILDFYIVLCSRFVFIIFLRKFNFKHYYFDKLNIDVFLLFSHKLLIIIRNQNVVKI